MNPLADVIPYKARRVIYLVVFVALLGWGAWQASEGNATEAVFGFLTALAPLLAAGNASPTNPSELER